MNYRRLPGHDYRGRSHYFITFATQPRRNLLSTIEAGRIHLKPEGRALQAAWARLPLDDPQYETQFCVIMPDHFHGIVVCRGGPAQHLGTLVNRMKARARQAIRQLHAAPRLPVWEPGYHDHVSFSKAMLDNFFTYVRDNPRRWQLRHDNPQWFRKNSAIRHPRLPAETTWTAYGDQTLLDYPWIEPVILSRRLEGPALEAEIAALLERVEQGAMVISGFISPGERRLARALLACPRARIVYLHPWGLARYKPRGAVATERLATGKTLVLSGFPDAVEAVATRANCLRNNEWARVIAATAAVPVSVDKVLIS